MPPSRDSSSIDRSCGSAEICGGVGSSMNFSYDPRKHAKIGMFASLGQFQNSGTGNFFQLLWSSATEFPAHGSNFRALTTDSRKDVSGKAWVLVKERKMSA